METYDYYIKALDIYKKSKEIFKRYSVGVKNSKESLYSVVMVENCNRIGHGVLDRLENSEEFCASCMYISLDSLRKAMHRYLLIETELTEDERFELNSLIEDIHTLCMPLNKCFNAKVETCVLVENEDMDKIKAYALINNPEYDDEDEENDY